MISIRHLVFVGALAILLPSAALASTISLTPATISTTTGNTFTVSVIADPAGTKVYTVRANISFDPAQVEFVSFILAPKWISLQQPGYDTEDNVKGLIVKTGGYPGALTTATTLGTATFRTKTAGSSMIKVTSDALVLDQTSKNTLTGTQGSVVVTSVAVAPKPVTTATTPKVTTPKPVATTTVATTTTIVPVITEATTTVPQVAAAEVAGNSSTAYFVAGIIALIIVIGGGIWFWMRRTA